MNAFVRGTGPSAVSPRALAVPSGRSAEARARARRVWCLLGVIAVLSFVDLFLTLTYLRSIGMGEVNPLAREVMSYNSPALLVAWKAATVGLAALILVRFRHKRSAELACWVCTLVLLALTAHWMQYNDELPAYASTLSQSEAGIFVQMTN